MKWQIIFLSCLFFVPMSFSSISADEEPSEESDTQITESTRDSIATVMKSGQRRSSITKSSKPSSKSYIKKVKKI